jgi:glycosyltransferase involved in cell wall biosynthesis
MSAWRSTPDVKRANLRFPVVHLLAPQTTGGLERAVELMAGGLASRGYRITAVLLLNPNDEVPPIAGGLEAAGVTVRPIRVPRRFYWREVREVGRIIRSLGAGILHTHGYRGDVVGYLAGRDASCALVSTAHGFTGGDLKNRFYEWLDQLVLRRFDAVLAVSAGLSRHLCRRGVPSAKVRVVENGIGPLDFLPRVEARRMLGLRPEGPCVGWVGRMTREKGADLAVRALLPLAAQGIQVAMVGDGPEREALQRTAGEGGVHWVGSVLQAGRYLPAFDVLVLSSRVEGTPMVLLEAMQAGVPVVAFAVGGVPALLGGGAGTLVPSLDVTALREAVRHLLDTSEEAQRRARVAREMVEQRFRLDSWLDRLEVVYWEVVRQSQLSP